MKGLVKNTSNHLKPAEDKKWYVLYTRARSEKKVADQLGKMGLESYCPVRIELRQWSDRKKKVEVPVLPSMVLVHARDQERQEAFLSPHAVRFLYWNGQPAIVPQREVDALRDSLTQYTVLSHETYSLEPGSELDLSKWGLQRRKRESEVPLRQLLLDRHGKPGHGIKATNKIILYLQCVFEAFYIRRR